jgi:hypothetical protein
MTEATRDTSPDRGFTGPLEPVDECTWRIPKASKPGMLVDGLIFADERLIPQLRSDRAAEQVAKDKASIKGIILASAKSRAQTRSLRSPSGVRTVASYMGILISALFLHMYSRTPGLIQRPI